MHLFERASCSGIVKKFFMTKQPSGKLNLKTSKDLFVVESTRIYFVHISSIEESYLLRSIIPVKSVFFLRKWRNCFSDFLNSEKLLWSLSSVFISIIFLKERDICLRIKPDISINKFFIWSKSLAAKRKNTKPDFSNYQSDYVIVKLFLRAGKAPCLYWKKVFVNNNFWFTQCLPHSVSLMALLWTKSPLNAVFWTTPDYVETNKARKFLFLLNFWTRFTGRVMSEK